MKESALRELGAELERLLPSPMEPAIDAAFAVTMERLKLEPGLGDKAAGKRVMLRMLVTIANTLSQPVQRESGVMRLPQTIAGLFDMVPKKRPPAAEGAPEPSSSPAAADSDEETNG
jgi:hypothetical protein